MTAYFTHRNIKYRVSGWLWSQDGAQNGMIITRMDGKPIRGSKIVSGMIQIGIKKQLEEKAEEALNDAREKEVHGSKLQDRYN